MEAPEFEAGKFGKPQRAVTGAENCPREVTANVIGGEIGDRLAGPNFSLGELNLIDEAKAIITSDQMGLRHML